MVQQVGEDHHFRSCDADAKLRGNRLEVGQREEAKAAQAEMPLGGGQADVALTEIVRRLRHGEQFDEPILRAWRLKSSHRQFMVRCVSRARSWKFFGGMKCPVSGKQALSDGNARWNGMDAR